MRDETGRPERARDEEVREVTEERGTWLQVCCERRNAWLGGVMKGTLTCKMECREGY